MDDSDEPPQLTVRPKIGPDLSPCILARETEPPIIKSTPKNSTICPPLKIIVRKDIFKIKKKSAMSFSSDEDQKPLFDFIYNNTKKDYLIEIDGGGLINESLADEELDLHEDEEEEYELPQDPDSYFHGFPEKHIPDWAIDDFKKFDLKSRFKIKPTVFYHLEAKRDSRRLLQQPAVPKAVTPTVSIKSPTKSQILKQNTSLVNIPPPPAAATLTPILDLHLISSSSKKKGKSDKNLNYIKPLLDGWVREVVWRLTPRTRSKKPDADVYYYPPHTGEGKKQRFRSANKLKGFLITSSSIYPITFFTFKKEPVGGPEGCEIVRDSVNVSKVKFKLPGTGKSPESPVNRLGKRVSKPPDKLILDITETDGNPSGVRKRVSKPPDKLELESMPVAKAPRFEINEKRQVVPVDDEDESITQDEVDAFCDENEKAQKFKLLPSATKRSLSSASNVPNEGDYVDIEDNTVENTNENGGDGGDRKKKVFEDLIKKLNRKERELNRKERELNRKERENKQLRKFIRESTMILEKANTKTEDKSVLHDVIDIE